MSGIQVFPFYLLCDTSKSMAGERIQAVNEGLPEIQAEILDDPIVDAKARISVISFSTEAKVDLPLTRLADVQVMPQLKAGGQTNYAKGMELTERQISDDVNRLIGEGYTVLRPCVYFLTDGRPGDNWKRVRDSWVDRSNNKFAPNVVGFGVADADEDTLKRLATQFSFIASDGVSPAAALREVLRLVTVSIVNSTKNGEMRFEIPRSDGNFRVIRSDE
jgi:uncharacterized protein YegL